jgi:hypothetical protein
MEHLVWKTEVRVEKLLAIEFAYISTCLLFYAPGGERYIQFLGMRPE